MNWFAISIVDPFLTFYYFTFNFVFANMCLILFYSLDLWLVEILTMPISSGANSWPTAYYKVGPPQPNPKPQVVVVDRPSPPPPKPVPQPRVSRLLVIGSLFNLTITYNYNNIVHCLYIVQFSIFALKQWHLNI